MRMKMKNRSHRYKQIILKKSPQKQLLESKTVAKAKLLWYILKTKEKQVSLF